MPEPRSLLSLRARGEKEGKVRGELEGCRIGGTGRAGFTLVNYPRERSDGEREEGRRAQRESSFAKSPRGTCMALHPRAPFESRAAHCAPPPAR